MTTESKRRPGRPRKAPSELAAPRLTMRTSEAQLEAYEAAARAAGHVAPDGEVQVSEWARAQLDAAAAHRDASEAAYLAGYRAAVREAAARIETMRRDAPEVTR